MKKKKEIRLMVSAIGIFVTFVIVCAIFMALSNPANGHGLTIKEYRILFVAGFLIVVVLMVIFWYKIFRPIQRLDYAIRMLDDLSKDVAIDLDVNGDTLAETIIIILDELKNSIDREHREVLLRQQSEYAELQSQINPHFLYNTLETIRGQAVIDDNYKIADMTEALGKYFRYNISRDHHYVTLGEELDNIKNYIQIQQYRFQDRFEFHIYNHDDSGETLGLELPKMTLQPIVENAIFHGMEKKIEKGTIHIHIETTKERLIILVADDGVGMSEENLEYLNRKLQFHEEVFLARQDGKMHHNGIAMENVNNRIQLLYGVDYGLKVSSTLAFGTEVEITIPRIVKEDEK